MRQTNDTNRQQAEAAVLKVLAHSSATKVWNGLTLLHVACRLGLVNVVRAICRNRPTNIDERAREPQLARDMQLTYANTPLEVACMTCCPHSQEIVSLLLDANAAIQPPSDLALFTATPLGYAVHNRNHGAIAELLARRADVNAKFTQYHFSALHVAATNGFVDLIDKLMQARANVDSLSRWNLTPLDCAVVSGQLHSMARLLQVCAITDSSFLQYWKDKAVKNDSYMAITSMLQDENVARIRASAVWSMDNHCYSPRHLKEHVYTMMLIYATDASRLMILLPRELLWHLFDCLRMVCCMLGGR
jgi:ankyrin repeat protein